MYVKLPVLKIREYTLSFGVILFISVVILLISVAISILKFDIFPEKFFFDHFTILRFMDKGEGFSGSNYGNVAYLYSFFGIDSLKSVISFNLIMVVFMYFYLILKIKIHTVYSFSLIVVFLLLSSIYLVQFSKDFWVLFIVLFLVFTELKTKLSWVIFILLVLIYGLYFRNYWLIVLSLFILLSVVFHSRVLFQHPNVKLYFFLITISFLLAFLVEFLGYPLSSYRIIVNLERAGLDTANTIIMPYIQVGNFFLEAVNLMITMFFLIIPLPLAALGLKYFLFFLFFLYLFIPLILYFKWMVEGVSNIIFYLFVVSFLLTLSMFEPDYGSFLRHFTPVIPILILSYLPLIKDKDRS